jgi:hypothetical protein
MEMLLALSIGAIVLTGCASTVITFMTMWSREKKQDLYREKEYSANRIITEEILKALFESVYEMDFSPLPTGNDLTTYLHWKAYSNYQPFVADTNHTDIKHVEYWLVLNDKKLSIHYKTSNSTDSDTPTEVEILNNCNGLRYLYITNDGQWESKTAPKQIKEDGQDKWVIPDSIMISIDRTL